MLVQLASLPVAISIPTLADHFDTGVDAAAWIVIGYLLMLGGLVLLGARLGDRYGHNRVFFIGIVAATVGSGLIALSQELWQVVMWRAVAGAGSAFVMGNANAILAATFPPEERGRAFAVPIIGSRFGTLIGLAAFAIFLHFFSWRLVFLSFVPLGMLAIAASIPMLRHRGQPRAAGAEGPLDWVGAVLLVGTAAVLVLSGSHLHGGDESFISSEGVTYHLPMNVMFVVLLVAFILVERRVSNPVVDMKHFRQKPFSLALTANVTFHFSMLFTMTLVPILVVEGFGKSPHLPDRRVASQPAPWAVHAHGGRMDIRPVPASAAEAGDADFDRGWVPALGALRVPHILLDATAAHVPHSHRDQHVQPGE